MSNDRPLIAYALLAGAVNPGGDVVQGLIKLFRPLAHQRANKVFSAEEFAGALSEFFGINIHPWAVEDLAPRMEAEGLLRKQALTASTYEFLFLPQTDGDVQPQIDESLIVAAVESFLSFSKGILAGLSLSIPDEELRQGFLDRLVEQDFLGILLKPDRSKEEGLKTTTITAKKPADKIAWEQELSTRARLDVLCASFLEEVSRTDVPLYDRLVSIATASLAAEAVLNFQSPDSSLSLQRVTFVLDCPFLMSLLDLTTPKAHEYAQSLCSAISAKGGRLAAFSHSIDEIRGNVNAVVGSVRAGEGYGPTAARCGNAAFWNYLTSIPDVVEDRLSKLSVRLQPDPLNSSFVHFPEAPETELRSHIGYYERHLAEQRDAHSVANIVRLRKGKIVSFREAHICDYVFVTENTRLAKYSASHLRKQKFLDQRAFPPCITDRYLAGLLWVIFGGKGTDLTRLRLIANCAAAMQPRKDVVSKTFNFLKTLDVAKAEHFRALMTNERAGNYLMQLSLGDSLLVTPDFVIENYEKLERIAGEKIAKQKDAEIEAIKQSHQNELINVESKHSTQIAELQQKAKSVEESKSAAIKQLETDNWRVSQDANSAIKKSKESETRVQEVEQTVGALQKDLNESQMNQIRFCLRKSLETKKRNVWLIGAGVVFAVALLNLAAYFLPVVFSSDPLVTKFGVPVIIAVSAVLGVLGIWLVPEYVFGGWLDRVTNARFKMLCAEVGLPSSATEKVHIDWQKGTLVEKLK